MTNNPEKESATAEDRGKHECENPKRASYLQELLEKSNKERHQKDTSEGLNASPLQSLDQQDQEDQGCQEQQKEAEVHFMKEQMKNYGIPNIKHHQEKSESLSSQRQQQPVTQFLQIPSHHLYGSEEQLTDVHGSELKDNQPPNSSRSASSVSSIQPSSPFIWRPIMPGYTPEKGNAREVGDLEGDGGIEDERRYGWASRGSIFIPVASEVSFKKAIPAMPKCLAFICFICNCIVPGLGTFMAGISIGCHLSISRNGPEVPKTHVICVNIRVAFLQLITTPLFLIGWIWSVVWAVAFVIIADEYDVLRLSTSSSTVIATHTTTTTISTVSTTITTNAENQSQEGFIPLVEPSIIVLHQAPIIIQPPSTPRVIRRRDSAMAARNSQSNPYVNNRRSVRRRRRARIRSNSRALNPILLDPATLEQLVHHSSIVPQADSTFVEVTTSKETT